MLLDFFKTAPFALAQPDESAIMDALKKLAAGRLNAEWDYSSEIGAIYSAVEKTRQSRGQLRARLA